MVSVLNPVEEFVEHIKRQVKDNNGFCIYDQSHNNKKMKCPKACGRDAEKCMCGLYVNNEPEGDDIL